MSEASAPPPGTPGSPAERKHITEHKHGGLGELPATAICGNDITSSCLYVSALAIGQAGILAPVALLLVAAVLYLFRSVYAEVVGALPLNGGAYNALLNTTSKFRASIAACLTILSYMATAVISAIEAMHYVEHLWHGFPVHWATVGLLAAFMVLTIVGIAESARVAIAIFLFHLASLTLLLVVGGLYLMKTGLAVLIANMQMPAPGGFATALVLGFSSAMLGISGFESSSNFVEEQAEGVFPKTLRNMWVAVSFFNPAMALLALALVPIVTVGEHKEALLAHLGTVAAGPWLGTLISIDAALVLSGAVLTSFVGVNGLVHRMTLDRCMPQALLKRNRRGTTHRIIIGFFLLSWSILEISGGDLSTLAGVYTISFLFVMVLFGFGNILLKLKRAKLPRPVHASWPGVLVAIGAVGVGIAGNIYMNPHYFLIFLEYFVPAVFIVSLMLGRITILKATLWTVRSITSYLATRASKVAQSIRGKIEQINSQQFVYFTRGDNAENLNKVVLYVRDNEHTNRIKIVTVLRPGESIPDRFENDISVLDDAYPAIDLELVVLEGEFGPELIHKLSEEWDIPTNLMFIGSPGTHFMYGLAELGGVRLII